MTSSQPSEAGVWLDRALGFSAAVLLFCLMMLTTADVVGRYIFNWPIRGAFEITELLLLTLIFAGLPLASRADEIAGYGDTTEVLRVPVGPFVYFMAIMVAVTGIVHLTKVFFPAPPRGAVAFDPDKPTAT